MTLPEQARALANQLKGDTTASPFTAELMDCLLKCAEALEAFTDPSLEGDERLAELFPEQYQTERFDPRAELAPRPEQKLRGAPFEEGKP